jgi:hypothetical protein
MDVIQLLVAETNKYYNQYLGTLDNDDRSKHPLDVTVREIRVFLVLITQIENDKQDTLKDYW